MRAPAPAALLAAGLLVFPPAALADDQCATPGSGLCKITSDDCLQRLFLSSSFCSTKDPSYTNVTLPAAGYYCCWAQGPFAPPPAQPLSAWLTIDDNGEVTERCLAHGACVEFYDLPEYGNCPKS